MKEELFNELLESVREGGEILRGKKSASRITEIDKPDVQKIRTRYNMSQSEFATMLGISTSTLQNWEQGRRMPQGPARVLLEVADKHPEAVWDTVHSKAKEQKQEKPRTAKLVSA